MKIRFKLYYFMQYFPIGIFGPYMAVFLFQKNFSGSQIGLLLGSMPVAMLILQPVWSYLSDILNTRRTLLVVGSLGVAVASVGLGMAETFPAAFAWGLLFSIMRAPIGPISNAIVLDYLDASDAVDDYGLIRLWGSLSFTISSLVFASLFLDQILVYFPWFLAGIYFLQAGLSFLLPEQGQVYVYSSLKGLQILRENPKFLVYLFGSIFIGATLGIHNNYQTLFLQTLDARTWLIGITVSIQALVEVPMMMVVPFLLKHVSMRRLILFGALVLPVRWLLYVFIQQPVWVIPTQLFHGIAVVSFFVVGISFIDQQISTKWRATGQGLYASAMNGIGTGLGVYAAGSVFEWFDIRAVWQLNVLLGMIGLALLIFVFRRHQHHE